MRERLRQPLPQFLSGKRVGDGGAGEPAQWQTNQPESVELRALQDVRHRGPLPDHHLGASRGRRRAQLRRDVMDGKLLRRGFTRIFNGSDPKSPLLAKDARNVAPSPITTGCDGGKTSCHGFARIFTDRIIEKTTLMRVNSRTASLIFIALTLSTLVLVQRAAPSIPSSGFPGIDQYRASRIAIYTDDFGELKRYRDADAALAPPTPHENRVVFLGASITDHWK